MLHNSLEAGKRQGPLTFGLDVRLWPPATILRLQLGIIRSIQRTPDTRMNGCDQTGSGRERNTSIYFSR